VTPAALGAELEFCSVHFLDREKKATIGRQTVPGVLKNRAEIAQIDQGVCGQDQIVRPVWSPDVFRWFSSRDYPTAMLVESKISEVKVRLLVDAAGKVTQCTSLSNFDAPTFNRVVCDTFMKRAKFQPAELADGTKVPSYYINRVLFKIGH